MFLFIRCTAIDPTDKTSVRRKKNMKSKSKSKSFSRLSYGLMLGQIILRQFRNIERKILKTYIRRKYLDPWKVGPQMEPLVHFPLVMKDDAVAADHEDNITFCSLCNFEVCNVWLLQSELYRWISIIRTIQAGYVLPYLLLQYNAGAEAQQALSDLQSLRWRIWSPLQGNIRIPHISTPFFLSISVAFLIHRRIKLFLFRSFSVAKQLCW